MLIQLPPVHLKVLIQMSKWRHLPNASLQLQKGVWRHMSNASVEKDLYKTVC